MAATLLDGHRAANALRLAARPLWEDAVRAGRPPHLVVLAVGDHPAARFRIEALRREAAVWDVDLDVSNLPAHASSQDVTRSLRALGKDRTTTGVVLARPLPTHLSLAALRHALPPAKDTEGLHPETLGRCMEGHPTLLPAVAGAGLALLDLAGLALEGTRAVLAASVEAEVIAILPLLARRGVTVTWCRPDDPELDALGRAAEILVVEIHRPERIGVDAIRPGAVVIDAGVNAAPEHHPNGAPLVGDVAFDAVVEVAGALTPVPGGVGACTSAIVLQNTVRAALGPARGDTARHPLPLFDA